MLAQLLAAPWLAILLGLTFGVSLFVPLFWSSRLPTQGQADIGLFVVAGIVLGGLIVALGLMLGYHFISPAGSVYFGLALVGGYLSVLGVFVAISFKKLTRPEGGLSNETRR